MQYNHLESRALIKITCLFREIIKKPDALFFLLSSIFVECKLTLIELYEDSVKTLPEVKRQTL